jgi:hypothetical protein
MAHFAKVENGLVTQVVVAERDYILSGVLGNPSLWIQTSYNTFGGVHYDPITKLPSQDQSKALRKNHASVGYTYDSERNAFIPPKPFASWQLNETTCQWEPPVPYPADGTGQNPKFYIWNENTVCWVLVEEGAE